LFQHPFISNATDPKPILDLLAEFKAEIVEEEIMDLNEDKEVRTMFFPPLRLRSNLLRIRKLMTEELFEKSEQWLEHLKYLLLGGVWWLKLCLISKSL
jgi:hypothetical protein